MSNLLDLSVFERRVFISPYGPKRKVSILFSGIGQTKQSFKDECDINTIMGRYLTTGVLPETVQQLEAQFMDVSEYEFQSSMELVASAYSMFNELPSKVRERFKNDPGEFLAFTSDEKNRPELAAMGLLSPEAIARMSEADQASKKPVAVDSEGQGQLPV